MSSTPDRSHLSDMSIEELIEHHVDVLIETIVEERLSQLDNAEFTSVGSDSTSTDQPGGKA